MSVPDRHTRAAWTRPLIYGLLLVAITIAIRLPLLMQPGAIDDEVNYSVVARQLMDGGLMYVDVVERRPPATFWLYEGVFRLFGRENWFALHAVGTAWVLLTMLALYVAAARLFGQARRFCGGAALRGVPALVVLGQSRVQRGSADEPARRCRLRALCWREADARVGKTSRRGRARRNSVPAEAAGRRRSGATRHLRAASRAIAPPGAGITGSTARCGLARCRGRGGAGAGRGMALRARHRAGRVVLEHLRSRCADDLLRQGHRAYGCIHRRHLPDAGRGVLVAPQFGGWRRFPAERDAFVWLLAVSAVAAAASGRFYPHYYIGMLPALSVLAAPAAARFASGRPSSAQRFAVLAVAWTACATIGTFVNQSIVGARQNPGSRSRSLYPRAR